MKHFNLIAEFLSNTISEENSDVLDKWVNESDTNMQMFEHLTSIKNVPALEKIIAAHNNYPAYLN